MTRQTPANSADADRAARRHANDRLVNRMLLSPPILLAGVTMLAVGGVTRFYLLPRWGIDGHFVCLGVSVGAMLITYLPFGAWMAVWLRAWLREERQRLHLCAECTYDLRGHVVADSDAIVCPECGATNSADVVAES